MAKVVYRAIIIAKLTCPASALWGFTTEADRQRLEAMIRRGKHTDHQALAELVERVDDELFDKVLINSGHVIHCSYTLPQCNYNVFKHSFVSWCLFTL